MRYLHVHMVNNDLCLQLHVHPRCASGVKPDRSALLNLVQIVFTGTALYPLDKVPVVIRRSYLHAALYVVFILSTALRVSWER
jgi:hypothetical protein